MHIHLYIICVLAFGPYRYDIHHELSGASTSPFKGWRKALRKKPQQLPEYHSYMGATMPDHFSTG
jgi:hypothetical protein